MLKNNKFAYLSKQLKKTHCWDWTPQQINAITKIANKLFTYNTRSCSCDNEYYFEVVFKGEVINGGFIQSGMWSDGMYHSDEEEYWVIFNSLEMILGGNN